MDELRNGNMYSKKSLKTSSLEQHCPIQLYAMMEKLYICATHI